MKILLVEDNQRLAALTGAVLTANGHSVDTTATIDEARAALSLVDYDLVLLDLSLPDGDGRDILNAIRQSQLNTFVLVITARGDVVSRVQALNAGADDYVVKPFDDDELLARIRAVGRRAHQLRDEVLTLGNVRLDTRSLTLTVGEHVITIPRRELSVLSKLLEQQGRVLRRESLETAVYSLDAEITDNAIEAVVSRLRRRLESAEASIRIEAMRGIGYVLTERSRC